jgi:phosphatidate cytidylyltransferase
MTNFVLRFITSLIIIPIFLILVYFQNLFIFLLITLFSICFYELLSVWKKKKYYLFLVLIFIIIFFVFSIFKLRGNTNQDYFHLVWFFLIVWLTDMGGYIFGKLLKGPKLSKWSPNKTISGVLGSIFLSQFSYLLINLFLDIKISYSTRIFLFQLSLSTMAIFGDLFFSYIKRQIYIKD